MSTCKVALSDAISAQIIRAKCLRSCEPAQLLSIGSVRGNVDYFSFATSLLLLLSFVCHKTVNIDVRDHTRAFIIS